MISLKKIYEVAIKEAQVPLDPKQKELVQIISNKYDVSLLPNKMVQIFQKGGMKKGLFNFDTGKMRMGNVQPEIGQEIITTIKQHNLQNYFMQESVLKTPRLSEKDVDPEELRMGIEIEMEHTDDREMAKIIALHHLRRR